MSNRRDTPPNFIHPQLSLLVKAPPIGTDWAHELKYDGYRIHARIERGEARLLTRTGLDWTARYEATASAVSAIAARSAYLDGELCAVHADGTTSVAELQAASDQGCTAQLVYFVFDLLFVDGERLTDRPLLARKEQLRALLERGRARFDTAITKWGTGSAFGRLRVRPRPKALSPSEWMRATYQATVGFGAK